MGRAGGVSNAVWMFNARQHERGLVQAAAASPAVPAPNHPSLPPSPCPDPPRPVSPRCFRLRPSARLPRPVPCDKPRSPSPHIRPGCGACRGDVPRCGAGLDRLYRYAAQRVQGLQGAWLGSFDAQRRGRGRRLREGVHVLVATPGRLNDLLTCRAVKLRSVAVAVLDEAVSTAAA